jgi:ABC1 atypical kinase-like domain
MLVFKRLEVRQHYSDTSVMQALSCAEALQCCEAGRICTECCSRVLLLVLYVTAVALNKHKLVLIVHQPYCPCSTLLLLLHELFVQLLLHTLQISEVFSEIAEEPAGAASLAQVYRAVLRDTGDVVAVKIQRPGLLPIITRDLYVMKKAVEVHLSQYICCSRTGSCRSHVSVTCSTTGNCCQTSYYCHYIGILSVFTVLAYILYFADRWQQPRMLCR